MVELTDREKKIVFIKWIMHGNEPFASATIELRENMLKMALELNGLDYDQSEMLDIGDAIIAEQQIMMSRGLGFLDKHKDIMKTDVFKRLFRT